MTTFTEQELNNFAAYEEVRSEGQFNMFDTNARLLTGLTKEDYTFVMKNFGALKAAYKEEINE